MDREETKIITKLDLMMFTVSCVLLGANIGIWIDKGDDVLWITKFAVVALSLSVVLTLWRWWEEWRLWRCKMGSSVKKETAAKKDDVSGEKI